MTVKDLEILYDYGYWANDKLFETLAQLAPSNSRNPWPAAPGRSGIRWFTC